MRRIAVLIALAIPLVVLAPAPAAHAAACKEFANQLAAERAANTADPDHDHIYCESLPCPCSKAQAEQHPAGGDTVARTKGCVRTTRIVSVRLSERRYPAVLAHMRYAVRHGWPRILTINRPGATARREFLLRGRRTKPGYDRDEWPMAFARKTIRASVKLVPSDQNRGAGEVVGAALRRYCDGTRFRVVGA